ncbi:MAG: aminotransferase class I/II-fold pyridoxal phosphate-dependent enzyme [Firmicutes bacterium]|nr:aminotransferase class I/II-fold pyridoxal phosphate-dependent enzyme [Bacillota bacterium]
MKYDFTTIINRTGMDSIAVDPANSFLYDEEIPLKYGISDHIPMWVADMNFATCPAIPRAMIKRAEHPLYGYFNTRDEYYDEIIHWHEKRNGVQGLSREHIGYENGVLGGVVTALRVLASQGGAVLVHSPTYIGFTFVLNENGFHTIHSPLVRDADGIWRMDYEDMEKKIVENKIHVAIFCSPHNPTGRVWEREEIARAMEIYEKHQVYVVADEIWSDIILDGNHHIPTQSVSEYARNHTVALYAPSKTFNLAGLIGSYHIIYNSWLKDRVDKESTLTHYNNPNLLSMYAAIGAYSAEGEEWLEELLQVFSGNMDFAIDYIRERFTGVTVMRPQGTYMLFLDCSEWLREHGLTTAELIRRGWEVGVDWQNGETFRQPGSIRMNLALPLSRVQEAFDRLGRYVFNASEEDA